MSFVSSLDVGVPESCHGDTGGESGADVNGVYGIFLILGNEVLKNNHPSNPTEENHS